MNEKVHGPIIHLTLLKWKKGVERKSKLTLFMCLMHIPGLIVHIIINKKGFPFHSCHICPSGYRLIAK